MSKLPGLIRNIVDAATDTVTIHIEGIIGWDVWGPELAKMLDAITTGTVRFDVYSYGGNVWEGNFITAKMREMQARGVATEARIYTAASMATLIACTCQRVTMAANGRFLVHNPWTVTEGDAEAHEKRAVELRETEQEIAEQLASVTEKPLDDILALMREERWLRAPEALELGLVDEIIDAYDPSAYAALNASMMEQRDRLSPNAIAAMAEPETEPPENDNVPPADTPPKGDEPPAEDGSGGPPADVPPEDTAGPRPVDNPEGAELAQSALRAMEADGINIDSEDGSIAIWIGGVIQDRAQLREELNLQGQRLQDVGAQLDAMTAERDGLTSDLATANEATAAANAEIERKETVIQEAHRRLRVFGAGIRGTDEDLQYHVASSAAYWEKVHALEAEGVGKADAISRVNATFPALHSAMIHEANRKG